MNKAVEFNSSCSPQGRWENLVGCVNRKAYRLYASVHVFFVRVCVVQNYILPLYYNETHKSLVVVRQNGTFVVRSLLFEGVKILKRVWQPK